MNYEFDGKEYEKASAHQKEWGTKLIEELHLQGNEHVLDLGCGDGALTATLAEWVPRGEVVGIDASKGMIEAARKHQAADLIFLLMDIHALSFNDEFDVVVSNATLHWIKNHNRLLENVYRSLHHSGILRFNFAGEGNCSHFISVVKEAMSHPSFEKYFSDFQWPWYMPSVQEYRELIQRHRFPEIKVWGENADRLFPDKEAMTKWIEQPSLVPFLTNVQRNDQPTFQRLVVSRMIEETMQEDGQCFETFRRVNVFARK
jgi:trans-aconitate 2-methyltransferase